MSARTRIDYVPDFTDGAKETVEGDATACLSGPLAREVADAKTGGEE